MKNPLNRQQKVDGHSLNRFPFREACFFGILTLNKCRMTTQQKSTQCGSISVCLTREGERMLTHYTEWKHVFKLDPAKTLSDEALEQLCESGTDAILVGGSDGIELDDVLELLMRIRRFALPVCLEFSSLDMITPGFDYYFIPTVLNSPHTQWVKDLHHQALMEHGEFMNWDEVFTEGYCVLNPDATVAHLTSAKTDLTTQETVAYARMAEHIFHLPIFYLEYSGTYGNPAIVQACKQVLSSSRLFYGGGIETKNQATEMAAFADTIVVGNVIYTDLKQALSTVQAVKAV